MMALEMQIKVIVFHPKECESHGTSFSTCDAHYFIYLRYSVLIVN